MESSFSRSRRTLSLSSSSVFSSNSSNSSNSIESSFSFFEESPLHSKTPLRFSGIPFSWEQIPGIPKKSQSQKHNNKESTIFLLPPPPSSTKKLSKRHRFQDPSKKLAKDPFFAAFVECSRKSEIDDDGDDRNMKMGLRSVTERFRFGNLYGSCRRTCSVSESLVYLPRSDRRSYDLVNRR